MTDSHEKLEVSGGASSSEKQQSGPKITGHTEVKKSAENVLSTAAEGADNAAEGADAMGNVSEASSEDKKGPSQGGSGGSRHMTSEQIEQLRAKLLASAPPQEVMINQIKKSLGKEESALEGEFNDLKSNPQSNPSRFVQVVARLRFINHYFESMINATYDYIKHLWLKIVHKI